MARDINIPLLRLLVQVRPVLWDEQSERFKDAIHACKAWTEVCIGLAPDFIDWPEEDKRNLRKEIVKTWENMKEHYVRSFRKDNELPISGHSLKARKRLYNERLRLAERAVGERRRDEDELFQRGRGEQAFFVKECSGAALSSPLGDSSVGSTSSEMAKSDDNAATNLQHLLVQALQSTLDNGLLFLTSMASYLKGFDKHQLIEFQKRVLHLIDEMVNGIENCEEGMAPDGPSEATLEPGMEYPPPGPPHWPYPYYQ